MVSDKIVFSHHFYLIYIYYDKMLTRLKHNGVGCKIGLYFIGALGYADDVVFAMSA